MEQLTSPDLYNIYQKVRSDGSGLFLLDKVIMHLPSKAGHVVFNFLPSTGQLIYNGSLVIANDTQITVADIESGELTWDVGQPDFDILLDTNYYVFDTSGDLISLLSFYYPLDVVRDVVQNVVNGGNFIIPEDGLGYDTDAGDFDTALFVAEGYSYDGGDFDTGERVGVAPPPITYEDYYLDGELDPEDQSNIILLDENFNPIETANMPNTRFFSQSVVEVDMSLEIDYTIECEIAYVSKYFAGFDYGAIAPDFGYDIDYGSLSAANEEGYDFNAINDYSEPVPGNSAS